MFHYLAVWRIHMLAYLQYYCHIVLVLCSHTVCVIYFLLSVWTSDSWIICVDDTTFELILKFHWNRTGTNTLNEAYKKDKPLPCFQTPQSHYCLHEWQSGAKQWKQTVNKSYNCGPHMSVSVVHHATLRFDVVCVRILFFPLFFINRCCAIFNLVDHKLLGCVIQWCHLMSHTKIFLYMFP